MTKLRVEREIDIYREREMPFMYKDIYTESETERERKREGERDLYTINTGKEKMTKIGQRDQNILQYKKTNYNFEFLVITKVVAQF